MSRRAPAKVRNLADAAKLVFVLSLLLAFAMRRGLAEVKDRLPWLGAVLFGLIVLTGGFLLVTAFLYRKGSASEEPQPETELLRKQDTDRLPDDR